MSWEKIGYAKSQDGMGFCDLICFNKTLLAKQCWRLMQNPESLARRIIKAKYYPCGSLLGANLRSRPSFAWRSLLSTRELLREGLISVLGMTILFKFGVINGCQSPHPMFSMIWSTSEAHILFKFYFEHNMVF
jgi:hypothetical protein